MLFLEFRIEIVNSSFRTFLNDSIGVSSVVHFGDMWIKIVSGIIDVKGPTHQW
jgi:hypothetical protein